MRRLALLLLAATAAADRDAELAVAYAIKDYRWMLGGRPTEATIESVRDRVVAHIRDCDPKTQASVRRVLNEGFEEKYGKDADFHRCVADMLAKSGGPGIAMVEKRFRGSPKRDELRRVLAEALGACGDAKALDALLRMTNDRTPEVAAAAVTGCAAFAKVKPDERKAAMRVLVDRFRKVADEAAGKDEETREARTYRQIKDPMNATLKAFSGGEELDSPQAWDAWLRENATKPWPE
jgi:hypothetical protein